MPHKVPCLGAAGRAGYNRWKGSILASVGVYAIGSRLPMSGRPGLLVAAVVGLFFVGLAKTAFHNRGLISFGWRGFEGVGRTVNEVTPRDGLLYAREAVYFTARRLPPAGLEHADAQKLRLPPALAASLHVVPAPQVDEWLAARRFDTVVLHPKDDRIERLGLSRLYAKRKEAHKLYIFWDKIAPSPVSR